MYKIPATTLFMGQNLIFVPECHSTNDLALKLCQNTKTTEGTVIVTAHQTAGRGQRGNQWEAEAGKNLTFSCVLRPSTLRVNEQFFLNIAVSLGVIDYLTETTTAKVQVKWPNDILVSKKKICGILIENQLQGGRIDCSVAGIGLNINQQHFATSTAVSLYQVVQREFDLPSVLERLLQYLEKRYLQLKQGQLDELKAEYLHHLYGRHQPLSFVSGEETFTGIITGIDELGRLTMTVAGHPRVFDLKEIRFIA